MHYTKQCERQERLTLSRRSEKQAVCSGEVRVAVANAGAAGVTLGQKTCGSNFLALYSFYSYMKNFNRKVQQVPVSHLALDSVRWTKFEKSSESSIAKVSSFLLLLLERTIELSKGGMI